MEGNSLDDFMRNVSTEVDQKVTGACSPYSKKKENRRPKKCPYDYIKAMNISKTSGWFGTDRLYLGYKWTGYLKMMFAFVALAFAMHTLGNSLIILGILWLMDLVLIYTGKLPPKGCFEDVELKRPGWRYLKDEASRSKKIKEEKDNKNKQDTTFTVFGILLMLGGAYAASR